MNERADIANDHDLGPDDFADLDLTAGQYVEGNRDVKLVLEVPLTASQSDALQRIAAERGITMIDAVNRMVEEGLEARAHGARRPAA